MASTQEPSPKTISEQWQTAKDLQEEGKSDAALDIYRSILELDDRYLPALHQVAQICESRGEFDEAIAAYQKAIEVDDEPPFWIYRHLGFSLNQTGDFAGAIAAYEKAIALQPEDVATYNLLGQVRGKHGDWEGAFAAYQKAIELQPEQPSWVYLNLGEALSEIGRVEEAISAYEKALALEPENEGIRRLLDRVIARQETREVDRTERAKQLQQDGKLDEALAEYRAVLAEDGRNLVALHQVALICEGQGKWNEAVEGYRQAVEVDAEPPFWVYRHLGFALSQRGDLDEAVEAYESAVELNPEDETAQSLLDQVVENRDRELFDRVLEIQNRLCESLKPISSDSPYAVWLEENPLKCSDLYQTIEKLKRLKFKPRISLIVSVLNTPEQLLSEMIRSVREQVYPDWELCLSDDASSQPHVRAILEKFASQDRRIKVLFRERRGGISAALNSALDLASGEFIALLGSEDLVSPDALSEVVFLLDRYPDADLIYADEDRANERGEIDRPAFKPDWCPDSLLSRNYIGRFGVYRRDLVDRVGRFRLGYETCCDYDLLLRVTEETDRIFHIPKILYHQRQTRQPQNPIEQAAGARILEEALERRGEVGKAIANSQIPGAYTIRYQIQEYQLVSIIIPTRNLGSILDRCLQSIFNLSTYPNYEVILIDNGSDEAETLEIFERWKQREPERFRCYPLDIPFNYAKLNNYGVSVARGDYLLFLNNDTEVTTPDWIEAMVEQVQRSSIGAVGSLLLYPDNTVQHAGVIIGMGGVAGHGHYQEFAAGEPGYLNQLSCVSNYSAVTAACLMCRREVFETVEGFEEKLEVAFNDVDFCLKMIRQGYRNIYLPHVILYHYESKSRKTDDTREKQLRFEKETAIMHKKWQEYIQYDPCYSPNLTLERGDYSFRLKPKVEAQIPVVLPETAYRAKITSQETLVAYPDEEVIISVKVQNVSPVHWQFAEAQRINLGNHWLNEHGKMLRSDDGRSHLSHLKPGEEIEVNLIVNTPDELGIYWLELDLVQEGLCWFAQKGSSTQRMRVELVLPVEGEAEIEVGEDPANLWLDKVKADLEELTHNVARLQIDSDRKSFKVLPQSSLTGGQRFSEREVAVLDIAFFCIRLLKGYGVDLVVANQAKYLASWGHRVRIYTLKNDGFFEEAFSRLGIEVFELKSLNLKKQVRQIECDVAIAQTDPFFDLILEMDPWVTKIAWDHGEPTPELFPGEVEYRREMREKRKRQHVLYHQTVVISEYIQQDMGFDRAQVVRNGVDHLLAEFPGYKQFAGKTVELAESRGYDGSVLQQPFLLCVARLGENYRKYKGTDELPQLSQRVGMPIVLAGKSENPEDVTYFRQQGLICLENLSTEELIAAYLDCAAYVSLSRWEGCNLPLVEAMAFDRPAFALDLCAHRETGAQVASDMNALAELIKTQLGPPFSPPPTLKSWKAQARVLNQLVYNTRIEHLASLLGDKSVRKPILSTLRQLQPTAESVAVRVPQSVDLSILILSKDRVDLLQPCIESLVSSCPDISYEILIGDTGSREFETTDYYLKIPHRIVYLGAYNFSAGNNELAQQARGKYLLLLNNDTEAILPSLAKVIQIFEEGGDKVGAIGGKLLYPDFKVQHAGVYICDTPPYRYVGQHIYKNLASNDPKVNESKIVPSVTGACLFTPRELYLKSGGLDERYEEECQDVDYCFKLMKQYGLESYYIAESVWIHKEGKTRTAKESSPDRNLFIDQWKKLIEVKNYFIPKE